MVNSRRAVSGIITKGHAGSGGNFTKGASFQGRDRVTLFSFQRAAEECHHTLDSSSFTFSVCRGGRATCRG